MTFYESFWKPAQIFTVIRIYISLVIKTHIFEEICNLIVIST